MSKNVYVWHVTWPSEQATFMLFMVMGGLVAYSQYKNCHSLAEFAIATMTTIITTIMTLKITKIITIINMIITIIIILYS